MDGLVQDCSISIVLAMEILQSCTKQSNYHVCVQNPPIKAQVNETDASHVVMTTKYTVLSKEYKAICL